MKTIHSFTVDGIRYEIVKTPTPHHFSLNKFYNSTNVGKIVGVESTIFGKKEMRFEATQPISYFCYLADRIAVKDAIAYLKKEYEAQ